MNNQQDIYIVNVIDVRGDFRNFVFLSQMLDNDPRRLRTLALAQHHLGHVPTHIVTHNRQ